MAVGSSCCSADGSVGMAAGLTREGLQSLNESREHRVIFAIEVKESVDVRGTNGVGSTRRARPSEVRSTAGVPQGGLGPAHC